MDIQQATEKRFDQYGRQDTHETRQHHQVHRVGVEFMHQRLIEFFTRTVVAMIDTAGGEVRHALRVADLPPPDYC